jgi:hypothetical protein
MLFTYNEKEEKLLSTSVILIGLSTVVFIFIFSAVSTIDKTSYHIFAVHFHELK